MKYDETLLKRDLRLTRLFFFLLSSGLIWIATDHYQTQTCVLKESVYGRVFGQLCSIVGPSWAAVFFVIFAAYIAYLGFSARTKQRVAKVRFKRHTEK